MLGLQLPTAAVASSAAATADILYKAAENRDERAAAFRLVHQAYVRAGLIEPHPAGMRVSSHQLQPEAVILIATLREEVISTVSLIPDGPQGLPMEAVYGNEVACLRSQGMRLAEVSALADRRRQISRTLPVFVPLMRLMVQSARRQGIDRLLAAVHPRHAKFYQRFLSFETMAEERLYPAVRHRPAVALALDFARLDRERPANYELFFAAPIGNEQNVPRPMPAEDIAHCSAIAAMAIDRSPGNSPISATDV